ncbi:MAG: hypothetical protein ACYS1C_01135 [Planctomycetota bacterium]
MRALGPMVMAVGLLLAAAGGRWAAAKEAKATSLLQQEHDLAGERTAEPRYYRMETKLVHYAEDGTRARRDTYRLRLMCMPDPPQGTRYVCKEFTLKVGDGPQAHIPAMAGWSYVFNDTSIGIDAQGQVFGIDHAQFQGLTDSNGTSLPPEVSYAVYNSFIDFHGFCNAFARPTPGGNGIQDLRRVGQKIVHAAAFTAPPVNLGSNIAEGSFFKNGEVTLELKGLSLVDGVPCALVGYDSGESSFKMLIRPTPEMEVNTTGASHYFGDVYVELDSLWVRKATMGEIVVSKTTMGEQELARGVIERAVTIRAVSAEEFEAPLPGE